MLKHKNKMAYVEWVIVLETVNLVKKAWTSEKLIILIARYTIESYFYIDFLIYLNTSQLNSFFYINNN